MRRVRRRKPPPLLFRGLVGDRADLREERPQVILHDVVFHPGDLGSVQVVSRRRVDAEAIPLLEVLANALQAVFLEVARQEVGARDSLGLGGRQRELVDPGEVQRLLPRIDVLLKRKRAGGPLNFTRQSPAEAAFIAHTCPIHSGKNL